jgi:hypothetical protein
LIDLDLLIAVGNLAFADDQRNLVKIPAGVGSIFVAEYPGEYIEMPLSPVVLSGPFKPFAAGCVW